MLKVPNPTVLTKPISLIAGVGKQARNYTRVVVWLVYEAFRGHMGKLAAALLSNIFYVSGQIGAIGVIYGYARLMERKEPLKVPLFDMTLDPSRPEILWAMVGLSALLFLASGVFQYVSRRITYKIAEHNLADSLKRLVVLDGRLPDPRAPMASRMLVQQGFPKILGGSRRGALMAVIFFNASAGALGAVAALVFLLWMDPVLTVLILAGVALGALSLYPIALRGVRVARLRERTQIALNKDLRELYQAGPTAERVSRLETPAAFAAAFLGRRRIVAEFTLVMGIAVTIILGMVVYYMASQALSGGASWAVFVAYIGALRMVLSGSTLVVRAFGGVSRFYPQIVPYYALMRDAPKLDQRPLAAVGHGDAVFLGSQANGGRVTVRAGDRLAVASTDPRREVQFAMMEAKAPASGMPVATTIVRSGKCLNDEAGIAVIELDLSGMGSENAAALDGALRDKVALFIHQSPKTVGAYGETSLLTVDEGAIERFVSLGTSESDLILEEFARKAAAARARATYDEDDEDEEV